MLSSSYELQVYTLAGMLGVAMLLGIDVLLRGLFHLLRLQMGMDTLVSFSCIATLADALTMISLGGREGQLPYCAVSALALGLTMWGTVLKLQGQRSACRTAASAHEPYLVTLDPGKWNGREAYTKWSGEPAGFGSQIQGADGAQRIFRITSPLLFIAAFLFSILSSLGRQRPELILWCLSATLTAAASFSAALCFGMPWNSLCRRLSGVGAAIAGWDGVAGGNGRGILLTDADLFPPGAVALNGIKIFGNFSVEKVVAVTATLIRDSGSGLDKIFHDLLRSQGAIYRRCSAFERCEGGLAADIRGEQILVGSAAFMHLMEVALPQGLNVKNAVFCAIDGELAGLFALNYNLHGAVRPAPHRPDPQQDRPGAVHPGTSLDSRHAPPAVQAAGGEDGVPRDGPADRAVRPGPGAQRHPVRRPLPGGAGPLLRGGGGGPQAAAGGSGAARPWPPWARPSL